MKYSFLVLAFLFTLNATSQEYQMKGNDQFVEIDILSSYYSQDGNNGAVTGGIGTEQLTDVSTMIIVNMPLDSTKSINLSVGADYYTSASTDNIDNNPSSASSKDVRAYANVGFKKKNLRRATTYGAKIGFSAEYDYVSFSGGLNFAKEFDKGNSELSISTQAFFDNWSAIYPKELRGQVSVPTTSRNSYNAQITYSKVINKKLQMAITAEAIYMDGLLSTPFHRVYFADQSIATIEKLPGTRLKLPFSIRANYYLSERLVIRSYYRYYTDDFGIQGHTANIELPIKLNDAWTIAPFYRYHTQTGSDYFAGFAEHLSTDEFYTSDYDLSELSSNKYGLSIGYSPLYGLARGGIPFTGKQILLNGINLRGSIYDRDTGLSGFSMALEMNIKI